ncbi:MAG: GNAT family N-acetyltransferase [Candidatus Omnitrophica bacterium]|nr:GNAT family N-acetyltransferase [Candidatus Omnitrophota bacterium]MDE2214719.1 GNAT family N-acetyltransferase [Candidatus Omnitrophota bacterium]MDE2231798.1 GNAT family N-acetyltransferase [Candidatus Omnitrophota bacterium]
MLEKFKIQLGRKSGRVGEIKPVRVNDSQHISIVASLAQKIWREHYTAIIGIKQVEYMLDKLQSENAIKAQIGKEGYMYFLLEHSEGRRVGYFAVVPRGEELFLSKFYITAEDRRRGYGKEALEFIEETARREGCSKIGLVVNKRNSSVKAYQGLGFVITDSVITNIGDGFIMDDYRMEKTINP